MRRTFVSILAVGVVTSCAPASGPEPPTPTPTPTAPAAAPAAAPVLRLLDITPRDGAPVDSGTVLVARLAYHLPDFDPERLYMVSAVFAGVEGGMYNRGGGQAQIRSPMGIVTVSHSLESLLSGDLTQPARPLTGSFFLLERDPLPTREDTVQADDRRRIRTVARSSAVRARSRMFYFNGTGPARNLGARFPDLLQEYWTYGPHKALAVAHDTPARWTYGYAHGYPSRDCAAERALQECRAAAERRGIDAPCRLVAVDDQEPES